MPVGTRIGARSLLCFTLIWSNDLNRTKRNTNRHRQPFHFCPVSPLSHFHPATALFRGSPDWKKYFQKTRKKAQNAAKATVLIEMKNIFNKQL
jgi:hypothetical protein